MATELSRDAVLNFLCRNGGRVKNVDLLTHFKKFLRDEENRTQNRELFKIFVNSVAVVKQDCGVAFVVLRKRYKGQVGDVSVPSSDTKSTKTKPMEISTGQDSDRIHTGQTFIPLNVKSKRHNENLVEHFSPDKNTEILSFNGTVSNVEILRFANSKPARSPEQTTPTGTLSNSISTVKSLPLNSDSKAFNEKCASSGQTRDCSVACDAPNTAQPPAVRHCADESMSTAKLEESRKLHTVRSFCPTPAYMCSDSKVSLSKDLKERKLHGLSHDCRAVETECELLTLYTPPRKVSSMSSSLCSESGLPGAQDTTYNAKPCSNGSQMSGESVSTIQEDRGAARSNTLPPHRSLSPERPRTSTDYVASHHLGPSGCHDSLPLLSSEYTHWPCRSPRAEEASNDLVTSGRHSDNKGSKEHEMLHRAEETKLFSRLQYSERKTTDWCTSITNLGNHNSSIVNSAPEDGTLVLLRSRAWTTSSKLRNLMCRSLGAELDQPLHKDEVSGRQSRLYLLSSSLSMNPSYSTPSWTKIDRKCASLDAPRGSVQSANDSPHFHQGSSLPLDSKEHAWMVKAAAGTWTNIYTLFREEPSLLDKRDFISGYTVLHWIAKHGDHRVLNTLWYGVNKAGMTLDVNVKTTCGYTPLHLAAMHNHKTLICLLVHKYKANVDIRDSSGKKPWQYIDKSGPRDLLELLGAPSGRRQAVHYGSVPQRGCQHGQPLFLLQRRGECLLQPSSSTEPTAIGNV